MAMVKRKYTYKPDLPDQRDHYFTPNPSVIAPPRVDLRSEMTPVEDQGNLGSCTANAVVGLIEHVDKVAANPHYQNYSRFFVYYNERRLEGTISQDSGAYIRDAIKAMAKWGVCPELLWPYKIKPGAALYRDAAKRKALEYLRVNQVHSEIQSALAEGFPVQIGFSVYESFESPEVARTGTVPMPKTTEQLLGGHSVVLVGYNTIDGTYLARNSWGRDWGVRGYFTFPFEYVVNTDLAEDFWIVKRFAGVS